MRISGELQPRDSDFHTRDNIGDWTIERPRFHITQSFRQEIGNIHSHVQSEFRGGNSVEIEL